MSTYATETQRRPTPCLESRIHAWCHEVRRDDFRPHLWQNRDKIYHGGGDVEGAYTYVVHDGHRVLAYADSLDAVCRKLGLTA